MEADPLPDPPITFFNCSLVRSSFTLQVQLRFNAYPYEEFGFISGRLNYISKVPSDSGFLATIRLKRGLTTNYGKSLPYKTGLKAEAFDHHTKHAFVSKGFITIL